MIKETVTLSSSDPIMLHKNMFFRLLPSTGKDYVDLLGCVKLFFSLSDNNFCMNKSTSTIKKNQPSVC